MLNSFYEYYEIKFGKAPKIIRKVSQSSHQPGKTQGSGQGGAVRKVVSSRSNTAQEDDRSEGVKDMRSRDSDLSELRVNGNQVRNLCGEDSSQTTSRILRPLSQFLTGSSSDVRELALIISRDICRETGTVKWEDVVGLDSAKSVLKESVVIPAKYPELFNFGGIVSPWRGVLLYGPPGTGKTLLAKAVAKECDATFFNISASSIVSKYRGDSEKLVRVLFDLARYHSPSTIFLDEIDSILAQRGTHGAGEHEASRRMKTELLIQMDGLSHPMDSTQDEGDLQRIFILAASNLPWDLDSALLRRLEKRVLVGLPNEDARRALFSAKFPPERFPEIDATVLASKTRDYSCADITLVCKEAAMAPVRRFIRALTERPETDAEQLKREVQVHVVTMEDALGALQRTKPSAQPAVQEKYLAWRNKYGSE